MLIIDDWGLEPLKPAQRNDLMEIMDDRHGHTFRQNYRFLACGYHETIYSRGQEPRQRQIAETCHVWHGKLTKPVYVLKIK